MPYVLLAPDVDNVFSRTDIALAKLIKMGQVSVRQHSLQSLLSSNMPQLDCAYNMVLHMQPLRNQLVSCPRKAELSSCHRGVHAAHAEASS